LGHRRSRSTITEISATMHPMTGISPAIAAALEQRAATGPQRPGYASMLAPRSLLDADQLVELTVH
jgi:hypothetical protein